MVSVGTCECGVPVGQVWESCVFAVRTQLNQLVSSRPIERVRQEPRQGCWAGRGAMLVLRVSANLHVLVNLETVVYALH